MDTNLTLEQIEDILVGTPESPYYIRQNIVIPNVSWGFLNHEADLLVINETKRLVEIEIKRSWADFMADFKKEHTHYDKKLAYLYYAVPEKIGQRVFDFLYEGEYDAKHYYSRSNVLGYTDKNPHMCGLIVYKDSGFRPSCLTVSSRRMSDYQVTVADELKLLRLGNMRVWKMKKKLAEYQVDSNLFK